MTETDMRRTLRKLGEANGFSFFSIETKGSTLGISDLLFSGKDLGGVIELKIFKGKRAISVPYRVGQRKFLIEHYRGNPRTFVLGYWPAFDRFYLLSGKSKFPEKYELVKAMCLDTVWSGERLDRSLLQALIMDEHSLRPYNQDRRSH